MNRLIHSPSVRRAAGFIPAPGTHGGKPRALLTGRALLLALAVSWTMGAASRAEGVRRLSVPVAGSQDPAGRLVRFLEAEVEKAKMAVEDVGTRQARLQEQMERLLEEAESIRPPEKKSLPRRPAAPQRIAFRPPLEQITRKNTLLFQCKEGRLAFIRTQGLRDYTMSLVRRRDPTATRRERHTYETPGHDGFVEISLRGRKRNGDFEVEWLGTARPGGGEPEEVFQTPGSLFRKELGGHDPRQCYVDFRVWPDSFETLFAARAIAWEAGYDVGWVLYDVNQPMRLRPGLGTIE